MPEILANEPDLIIALIHSGAGRKDSIPCSYERKYRLSARIR